VKCRSSLHDVPQPSKEPYLVQHPKGFNTSMHWGAANLVEKHVDFETGYVVACVGWGVGGGAGGRGGSHLEAPRQDVALHDMLSVSQSSLWELHGTHPVVALQQQRCIEQPSHAKTATSVFRGQIAVFHQAIHQPCLQPRTGGPLWLC